MLFNSGEFLLFFAVVALVYFLLPSKIKNFWLLVCSYYFYMCWSKKYVLLLLFSTVTTWLGGLVIERLKAENSYNTAKLKKLCVTGCFVLNFAVLGYFKYVNFIINNVNKVLEKVHAVHSFQALDILLPVGISFYIFQGLGYVIDVYRDDFRAERNFFKYALFMSFFPQISSGPIARSTRFLKQFDEEHRFSFERARSGFMLMLWGYFLKMILADRISVVVDTVFNDFRQYTGWYLIVASLLFSIQIYCDFSGYSTIAAGAAEIMGFSLDENFNAPYFAQSVSEFWRRWHISLSSWFRDYLYIPLGGNRKGTLRKYFNIMVVFVLSGLWHGSSWSFIAWGGMNGLFQILGSLLKPLRDKAVKVLHLNRNSFSHKVYKTAATFWLVTLAWVFFRANSFKDGLRIIKRMLLAKNIWILFDDSLFRLGLDWKNFMVMLLAIALLAAVDMLKKRGIVVREVICRQELWFRWLVLIASIMGILLFGMWGSGYNAATFIYFQF